jgi:hypothetical protein
MVGEVSRGSKEGILTPTTEVSLTIPTSHVGLGGPVYKYVLWYNERL